MQEAGFIDLNISMCNGNECPLKDDCLRYKAKPSKIQSYFMEIHYNDGKCEHFISC